MDANWTSINKESRRDAKFKLIIVDFARGPSLTTVSVASKAIMDYQGCLNVSFAVVELFWL